MAGRTIDSPSLRLDFDVSHFEVVGVPMDESVGRLAPLAGAAEIKDQHFRYLRRSTTPTLPPEGWLVDGNGVGRAFAPDGRPVEYQFLLGGEGTFDLPKYLQLMHAQASPRRSPSKPVCSARPGPVTTRWRPRCRSIGGWPTVGARQGSPSSKAVHTRRIRAYNEMDCLRLGS